MLVVVFVVESSKNDHNDTMHVMASSQSL